MNPNPNDDDTDEEPHAPPSEEVEGSMSLLGECLECGGQCVDHWAEEALRSAKREEQEAEEYN
jgi:hypothetical protein